MKHPCINGNCAYWKPSYVGPRKYNGVDCHGYMDYYAEKIGWSACSVSDLSDYSWCLEPLGSKGKKLLTSM